MEAKEKLLDEELAKGINIKREYTEEQKEKLREQLKKGRNK
ncbi:MAG: hypothetical protein BWY78_00062 [Alphaproteobacteria bacterium ADurb.Bin438]|nr:MAG: hypothetical protein BWY78_00062 [Alphaproteobacteria bacterium ADurb.Bin438]